MNFVVIFGPPAVGKMTVGHELTRLTGFRLFHNHMTIDLVLPFFDFGTPSFSRLVADFRRQIFEEVAGSSLPGLIFTYAWALDQTEDKDFIDRTCAIFQKKNATIHFVELEASLESRLHRNGTEFRLSQKPPKRNVEKSRQLLLENESTYQMNTRGDFFYPDRHLKICNDDLSPAEVAWQIVEHFKLPKVEASR